MMSEKSFSQVVGSLIKVFFDVLENVPEEDKDIDALYSAFSAVLVTYMFQSSNPPTETLRDFLEIFTAYLSKQNEIAGSPLGPSVEVRVYTLPYSGSTH